MRVKREDERAELRWKPWLREKAILVWARLMQEMIKVVILRTTAGTRM